MDAGLEHGVLSHALALSTNGVDVGEVDEVVEDEEGRDSRERERGIEKEKEKDIECERKRTGASEGDRSREKRREEKAGGKETGDKERRVDDEGRRR